MKATAPIIALYWRETPQNRALRAALLALAGLCLLTLSAKFKVPYYPVPMTLQTLVVLALPFVAGSAPAAAAVLSYLALGAAGAPVFSGGGGVAYLAGPTGGFLIGFAAATALLALARQHGAEKRFITALAALIAADALIFACGVTQLALVIGDVGKALALGFYPFIFGDMSKAVLAAAAVTLIYQRKQGGE